MSPNALPVSTHTPSAGFLTLWVTVSHQQPLLLLLPGMEEDGSTDPKNLSRDLSVHVCSLVKLVSEREGKKKV